MFHSILFFFFKLIFSKLSFMILMQYLISVPVFTKSYIFFSTIILIVQKFNLKNLSVSLIPYVSCNRLYKHIFIVFMATLMLQYERLIN